LLASPIGNKPVISPNEKMLADLDEDSVNLAAAQFGQLCVEAVTA